MTSKTKLLAVQGLDRYVVQSPEANSEAFLFALYSDGDKRQFDMQFLVLYQMWLTGLLLRQSLPDGTSSSDISSVVNTWILVQATQAVFTDHVDLSDLLQQVGASRSLSLMGPISAEGEIETVKAIRQLFPFAPRDSLEELVHLQMDEPRRTGLVCNRVYTHILSKFTNKELARLVKLIADRQKVSVQTLYWSQVLHGTSELPHPGYSLLYHTYASASCRFKPIRDRLADIFIYTPEISFAH